MAVAGLHLTMKIPQYQWIIVLACLGLHYCNGGSKQQTVTIFIPGDVVAPAVVSVKEGGSLRLICRTSVPNTSILWTKSGNDDFYYNAETLYLERVRLEHGGQYTCSVVDSGGQTLTNLIGIHIVDLNVLYGPGRVSISGPNSALHLDMVELGCSATGNPQPSFWWSLEDTGEPVLHRGPHLIDQFPSKDETYYCFAENILIPTQGNSTTHSARAKKLVDRHERARIYQLLTDYEVEEGDTLNMYCKAVGNPPPVQWWTIVGNNTVIYEGGRLVIQNIPRDFDGFYSCFAENTVVHASGNSLLVTDSLNTYIHVNPKGPPTSGCICSSSSSTLATPCSEEACASKCNVTSDKSVSSDTVSGSCNDGIIAALAIGWIVVVILVVIGIFYVIRVRENRKIPSQSSHHLSEAQTETSLVHAGTSYPQQGRPQPPKRPIENQLSNHIYMSLDGESVNRGNPDGNHSAPVVINKEPAIDPDTGYLAPNSRKRENGEYVEPNNSTETSEAASYDNKQLELTPETA